MMLKGGVASRDPFSCRQNVIAREILPLLKRGKTMVSKKMESALNMQVNRELYSAYLYLAMSAWAEAEDMRGFAKWLRVQANEERSHAMKIFDFILKVGGTPDLLAIEAPKRTWKSMLQVFTEVLEHEQKVTGMIHGLVDLAVKEKDYASQEMLWWFVKEQVEEETQAREIVAEITKVGDVPGHLFYLDHQLGKRE